ncbi:acyl--CoA ligase, partial [candidate division KSB1 bacterium]|nr:acyl--CoA ligase [candidate division KSB1 bacterium]
MENKSVRTLQAIFQHSIENHAQRPALGTIDDAPLTYAEVGQRVSELSVFLHKNGIVSGDRVAILSENCVNWPIAFFAVTTMGAVVVPILPDFHANEVHHILRHSNAKAVFISEKLYSKLEDVNLEEPNLVILIDDFSIIPPRTSDARLKEMLREGGKELAKLREAALRFSGLRSATVGEEDLASIIYTSG